MSDIPGWAVRGAKVVCVETTWQDTKGKTSDPFGQMRYPEHGETYTIREVRVRYVTEWNELLVGVLVDEVHNPIADGGSSTGEEPAFDIRAFRPLTGNAMKADLAKFAPLLDRATEQA